MFRGQGMQRSRCSWHSSGTLLTMAENRVPILAMVVAKSGVQLTETRFFRLFGSHAVPYKQICCLHMFHHSCAADLGLSLLSGCQLQRTFGGRGFEYALCSDGLSLRIVRC